MQNGESDLTNKAKLKVKKVSVNKIYVSSTNKYVPVLKN